MSHNMLLSMKISAVAQPTSEMMGINTETHNGQRAESGKLGSTLSCTGGLYQSLRDLPGHHVSSMWLTGILSNITAINYGGSASRQRPSKSSPPFLPRAFSPPNSSYATYFLIATVDKHPRVHIQTPHTLAPIFSAPLFFYCTINPSTRSRTFPDTLPGMQRSWNTLHSSGGDSHTQLLLYKHLGDQPANFLS